MQNAVNVHYDVLIDDPKTHLVRVRMHVTLNKEAHSIRVFLPAWCPGSYMIRDYSRHIKTFKGSGLDNSIYACEQKSKNIWEISGKSFKEVIVEYEVYAHELTVRTSHVDESHAFLHGPSLLMGVCDSQIMLPTIRFHFPNKWKAITTSLNPIGDANDNFVYQAADYDELIDCPIEIGNHHIETFQEDGKETQLAFYGHHLPSNVSLFEDMKTIIRHVCKYMGGAPYERYAMITHWLPKGHGGLEHLSSCVLIADPWHLSNRKKYLDFLSLVAHEYFHTWNVKRIRPVELGPFNYFEENYTSMLWLAEGLTSFMDELFVYRAGLCTLEEYLEWQTANFQRYFEIPGRFFHSLEQSSFNAWIKLYKPDENSQNSSISYYLKGGIAFFLLNARMHALKKGNVDLFISKLWQHYINAPKRGLSSDEVIDLLSSVSGKEIGEEFALWLHSTQDPDIDGILNEMGLEFEWSNPNEAWLGMNTEFKGDRVLVTSVVSGGPAFVAGINAGDEILAINNYRCLVDQYNELKTSLVPGMSYSFLLARQGRIVEIGAMPTQAPRRIKLLKITNREKVVATLNV